MVNPRGACCESHAEKRRRGYRPRPTTERMAGRGAPGAGGGGFALTNREVSWLPGASHVIRHRSGQGYTQELPRQPSRSMLRDAKTFRRSVTQRLHRAGGEPIGREVSPGAWRERSCLGGCRGKRWPPGAVSPRKRPPTGADGATTGERAVNPRGACCGGRSLGSLGECGTHSGAGRGTESFSHQML